MCSQVSPSYLIDSKGEPAERPVSGDSGTAPSVQCPKCGTWVPAEEPVPTTVPRAGEARVAER
ncbi:hypothetical protein PG994_007364 [Apiospora phragmitis]|uniref:Uncharacterized protein n=1 Tax=Apiospora phragmitis TaxID=2905665 RepID=A0ABR1V0K7_9PEZI